MSSRWWFPFNGMEEMSFKRVPDGWVYRAPNPWLFGSGRYYLLNEKQKSEITGRHRRMWRFLFFAILAVVVAGVPLIPSGLDEQRSVAMLAATVLVEVVIGFVSNAYLYRAVRPIVAGLEPTTQRITRGEAFKTQLAVFSRGYILFLGFASLALFALSALPALTSGGWDLWSLCGVLLFGTGALYWFALYIAKRRQSAG